jgi:activating signal cointegrator complex subunit 2
MDQMKADILRRVEELDMEEDEDMESGIENEPAEADIAYEDDIPGQIAVNGDGENTDDEDVDGEEISKASPETILELAYLRDQQLFARDAQTRRSKERADLKALTGWSNEQIEGWKVMLDRNVRILCCRPMN